MTSHMQQLSNLLTPEQKDAVIEDLTLLAFNLATTLRSLELVTEGIVDTAEDVQNVDFTRIGMMLLTMREEGGPLSDSAIAALDDQGVNMYILNDLSVYAESLEALLPTDEDEVDEDGYAEVDLAYIVAAIEQALAEGTIDQETLDVLLG